MSFPPCRMTGRVRNLCCCVAVCVWTMCIAAVAQLRWGEKVSMCSAVYVVLHRRRLAGGTCKNGFCLVRHYAPATISTHHASRREMCKLRMPFTLSLKNSTHCFTPIPTLSHTLNFNLCAQHHGRGSKFRGARSKASSTPTSRRDHSALHRHFSSSTVDFRLPQLSPSFKSGTVTKWHKETGDAIAVNDLLLDLQTNTLTEDPTVKQTVQIEAQEECKLAKQHAAVGDTVKVNDVLCTLDFEDEDMSHRTIAWQAYTKKSK